MMMCHNCLNYHDNIYTPEGNCNNFVPHPDYRTRPEECRKCSAIRPSYGNRVISSGSDCHGCKSYYCYSCSDMVDKLCGSCRRTLASERMKYDNQRR